MTRVITPSVRSFDSGNRRLLRKNVLEWEYLDKKYKLEFQHVFPKINLPDGFEKYTRRVLSGMKPSFLEEIFSNRQDAGTYVMFYIDDTVVAQGKSHVHPSDMFKYDPFRGEKAAVKRMLRYKASWLHDTVYLVLTGPGGRWYDIINKTKLDRERAVSIIDDVFPSALHQATSMEMDNAMRKDWQWLKKYVKTK